MKKEILTLVCLSGLTLPATGQLLLSEDFNYPNGNLVGAPGSPWTGHSGTTFLMQVDNSRAFINQNDTASGGQDVNAPFALNGSPIGFAPDSNANNADNLLFASFTVQFTALPPDTTGSYFAHFKSTAANEFYGRIGASVANAASGQFRLAIANETWGSTTVPVTPLAQDLSLNTVYTVVTRHNVDTGESTLWLNPTTESSPSVTATDARNFDATGTISQFALRQGTSGTPAGAPGDLFLDNLRVGRTFSDVVVPEPRHYALLAGLGLLALGAYRRTRTA